MTIQGNKLECGSCGASSLAPQNQTLWKCNYCATITVFDGIGEINSNDFLKPTNKKTRKIEPVIKKRANYLYPNARFKFWGKFPDDYVEVADGGYLIVTNTEVIFVPHAFNFTSYYRLVFPFEEISDIRKENKYFGIFRKLILIMKDSSETTFVVWNRDDIIKRVKNSLTPA